MITDVHLYEYKYSYTNPNSHSYTHGTGTDIVIYVLEFIYMMHIKMICLATYLYFCKSF